MPALESMDLYQTAVVWPAQGFDPYSEVKVGDPYETQVRWNDAQAEALDPQGNTVALDATVIVDVDIPIESIMFLGEIADYNAVAGQPGVKLMQVKTFNNVYDLKCRFQRRQAGLMRYRASLPAHA